MVIDRAPCGRRPRASPATRPPRSPTRRARPRAAPRPGRRRHRRRARPARRPAAPAPPTAGRGTRCGARPRRRRRAAVDAGRDRSQRLGRDHRPPRRRRRPIAVPETRSPTANSLAPRRPPRRPCRRTRCPGRTAAEPRLVLVARPTGRRGSSRRRQPTATRTCPSPSGGEGTSSTWTTSGGPCAGTPWRARQRRRPVTSAAPPDRVAPFDVGASRPRWRPRSRTRPSASGPAAPAPSASRRAKRWTSSLQAATPSGALAAIRSAMLQGRGTDLVRRDHRIDQPDLVGPLGASMLIAGHGHLEGDGQRDPTADRRAAAAGEEAATDLRQAELRLGGGDDQVAPQQQLESARHGRSRWRPRRAEP